MPTKRMFDLVVLSVVLMHPVTGLFRMWATRKAASTDDSPLANVAAGAVKIWS